MPVADEAGLYIDLQRVQRVANEMFQFRMLSQPFKVSTMLGGL